MKPFVEQRRSLRNDAPFVICLLLVMGHLALSFIIISRSVPPEVKEIVSNLMNGTQNMLLIALGYFYGASKTAQQTAEKLATVMPRADIKAETVNVESDNATLTERKEP